MPTHDKRTDLSRDTLETDRDGGDGNSNPSPPSQSKQQLQLKNWSFTLNNYTPDHIEIIFNKLKDFHKTEKFVFQEETGESGTPHLQGNVVLKKKGRWSEFKLPKEIHWTATRNAEAAWKYCMKAESRTGKIFTYGGEQPLKLITEMRPWQQTILDIIMTEPDDRTVNWIYDEQGGQGKTQLIKYLIHHHEAILCNGGKASDMINVVFNAYQNKKQIHVVLFSLTRPEGNRISTAALESIKDGCICNTKYETGSVIFNSPHVFVFANLPPDRTTLTDDRWNIIDITPRTSSPASVPDPDGGDL